MLPGMTAQIIVQAVNGNSQGVACDPLVYTVPAAVETKVTEPKKAPALSEAVASRNGNGNGSHHRREPALA